MLRRAFRYSRVAPVVTATSAFRGLHSAPEQRAVKVSRLVVDKTAPYPTVYDGLDYDMDVFGLTWTATAIKDLQSHVWDRSCFLPTKPAAHLTGTPFAVLSDVAAAQAIKLRDGTPGLIAKNQLRATVKSKIVDAEAEARLFDKFKGVLADYLTRPSADKAQLISNVAFWCQWLIRGVLFEGKMHGQKFTDAVVPAPLSTLAMAANAALGRHQIEFVYDDYTLKAANFPTHRTYADVNYADPQDIVKYIAEIDTPVGWCDMAGGNPEHNFRHNHSLMEEQMRGAFEGWQRMSHPEASPEDIVAGWASIATASERAHRVFNTMMVNTPADSYPLVRLMIKGVRGACGNVYPPHGVFYEGCGTHAFDASVPAEARINGAGGDAAPRPGCYVDHEFGQTGANSSMYKWLDIFAGVTTKRHAYDLSPEDRDKMIEVLKGHIDPGDMGVNPIDSMQRAFDLLTRPPLHLDELAKVSRAVQSGPYLNHEADPRLKDNWELAAFERLRAAYFVASHRNVHGKYVLKMIYQTTPIGGQSRAEGTGGSTPPFLKTFFDQTFGPAMDIHKLLTERGRKQVLGPDRLQEMDKMKRGLEKDLASMTRVQQKGLELEREEKGATTAAPSQPSSCPFSGGH